MSRGKQAGSGELDTGTYEDLLVPVGALASSVAGAGRGVLSQSLGVPGDLEGLGREGLNWLGKNYSDEFTPYGELPPSKKTNIVSKDTFLPTTEKYRDKILPQIGEDTYAKLGSYSPVAPGVYLNAIKQGAKGVKAADEGLKALKVKPKAVSREESLRDGVDTSRRKFLKNTGIAAAAAALPAAVKGLHGLEEARGIKTLEEVAPVARNAAHLRNLELLRSAREAWKAKIAKISDDFYSSPESDWGNNPTYDDESSAKTRLDEITKEQNVLPNAKKELIEQRYENPIQTIYNKHKDVLSDLDSQAEKDLLGKLDDYSEGKGNLILRDIYTSPEITSKKYKIIYDELKSMFGDDIPSEYLRDLDNYVHLHDNSWYFDNGKPKMIVHPSSSPNNPNYTKNSLTRMFLNDQDNVRFGHEDNYTKKAAIERRAVRDETGTIWREPPVTKRVRYFDTTDYQSGGIVNDPMNPMNNLSTEHYGLEGWNPTAAQSQGVASLGRGNDTMLVHMTPKEVQGLQTLAKAHGGSLTTNPYTGLPEAGFLDSIMPVIVGIGAAIAAPFTAGTSLAALGPLLANPFVVGGLSGLGAMAANGGDLGEGLKWGLGVGGGASLGNGLSSMVTPVANVGASGGAAGATGVGAAGTPLANAGTNLGEVALTPQGAGVNLASNAAPTGVQAGLQNLSNMGAGLKNAFTTADAYKAFDPGLGKLIGTGGRGMLGTAGLGLASMAFDKPDPLKPRKSQQDKDYGPGGKYEYKGPYTFPDYGPVTYATPKEIDQGVEHSYFGDKYNLPPQYVEASKEGGVIGMAGGGDVGEQSYFGNDYYNSGYGNFGGMPSWMADNPAWTGFWHNIQSSPFLKNILPQNNPYMPTTQDTTPYANSGAGYSDAGEQMFFSPSYFSTGQGAATPAATTTPKVTGAHAGAGIGTRSGNGIAYPQAPGTAAAPTGDFGRSFNNFITQPNVLNAIKGPFKPKGMAAGGIADLPGAPAGTGNVEGMLSGPGDGMSDSIPARIDGKQEARLATGEFVIPADVVSHLGNGASEPGAKVLYAMMDRVRKARTGNPEQGKEINPDKFLPA